MQALRLRFDHGLGDCVHFAHLLQLYKRRGYQIGLHGEDNKQLVWDVAGVASIPQQGTTYHPWTYPASFHDLDASDADGNKVAHGINHPPLPVIGDKAELWRELCGVRLRCDAYVPATAHAAAAQFLDGLPPPYLLLHTHGTHWPAEKNVPAQVCLDLFGEFLAGVPGSVIVLDWDYRAPMIGHERVRGLKPFWGHIGLAELAALCARAHLFLGIDSGPFHFAALTGIPALGVFRHIHATRCCLPNPNAVYLVPARHHRHWAARRSEWHLAEYAGDEPTAGEIAEEALALLAAGRPALAIHGDEATARVAGRYLYRRVGYDERPLVLLPDGTVGEGAAGCEQSWIVRNVDGRLRLTLLGHRATSHLIRDGRGVWHGRWLHHEKMPVELIPFGTPAAVTNDTGSYAHYAGFWIRQGYHGDQDRHVVNDIYLHDSYRTRLRGTRGVGEVVVDIGAHIGAFARRWHEKNPHARIICVEACPENVELLRRNVGDFADVVHAACTYETGPVRLLNSVMEGGPSTGGSIVVPAGKSSDLLSVELDWKDPQEPYWEDERPLPKVTLEDLMARVGTRHIDVLKLDCEGSEYSILGQTPSLAQVYFTCGEYHGLERWDRFRAERFPGWEYLHLFAANGLGIFHYVNPTFAP